MKFNRSKIEAELKRGGVSQSDIDEIISLLKKAESKGLRDENINIVVDHIVKKPGFGADFLRNPWGSIEKVCDNPWGNIM
jgi:hypothetical protein